MAKACRWACAWCDGWNRCPRVLLRCVPCSRQVAFSPDNKERKMVHHPKTNDEYNALKVNGKLVVVDFS